MLGGEATVDEVLVNAVEGPDVFHLGAVAKWGCQNGIAIIDVADEHVLVTLAGGDREASGQICGDFITWTCDGREHHMGFGVGHIGSWCEILFRGSGQAG